MNRDVTTSMVFNNTDRSTPGAAIRKHFALLGGALICCALVFWQYAGANGATPDFSLALTFVLTLSAGFAGLSAAFSGALLAQALGASLPVTALAVQMAAVGLLVLYARRHGLQAKPGTVGALLAIWGFAAVAAALAASFDGAARVDADFLRRWGWHGLLALAAMSMTLPLCWLRWAEHAPSPSAVVALAIVLLAETALLLGASAAHVGAASLPIFACAGALLAGSVAVALIAGFAGVALHGVWFALILVWIVSPPHWLALFAPAQIAASVIALVQQERWRLMAGRLTFIQNIERQNQLELYRLVAEYSVDMISVHAANFDFCYSSPSLHRLLGLAADERPGPIAMLLPRLHPADRPQTLPEHLPPQGRFRFRIRGGDFCWHWLESLYTAIGEGESRRYVVITRDIGAHVEQTESLHAMALHDPMTQLYNRRAANTLGERLWEEALARRTPFAVIMLDIDHFKKINDRFGHDTGDEAIKRVAAILPEHVRQRDMVCRWGGEEFLMLLPESDVEGAFQIAERVRGEVASTVLMAAGERVQLRISAGVTQRTEGDATLAEVIDRADQGLYAAKEQGRNRVVPMRRSA